MTRRWERAATLAGESFDDSPANDIGRTDDRLLQVGQFNDLVDGSREAIGVLTASLGEVGLPTPPWLELRFNSRVTVEGWTPIASAIDFFEHFLCSNTEIVYLCSEVSCLYISNAKLINLWEIPVSHYCFFALPD